MFWRTKNVKFHFRWGTKPRDQNRRLGMIVTSFQDFKLSGKQISQSFSYCELTGQWAPGANHFANKKMSEKSVFPEASSWNDVTIIFNLLFWPRGFVFHRKWNSRFWYVKTRGRKIAIKLFCYLQGVMCVIFNNSPVSNSPWPLNKSTDNAFVQG